MPPEEVVAEVLGIVMWKAGLQPTEDGLPVVVAEEFHALSVPARTLEESPLGFCGKRGRFHGKSGTPAGMADFPMKVIT
jgi:hypothetical protein